MKLTVYWDGGFWVGVVEQESGGRLKTCRHIFGSKPLKAELEHRKRTRRIVSREQREAEQARKRELAVQKAKAKHRGR